MGFSQKRDFVFFLNIFGKIKIRNIVFFSLSALARWLLIFSSAVTEREGEEQGRKEGRFPLANGGSSCSDPPSHFPPPSSSTQLEADGWILWGSVAFFSSFLSPSVSTLALPCCLPRVSAMQHFAIDVKSVNNFPWFPTWYIGRLHSPFVVRLSPSQLWLDTQLCDITAVPNQFPHLAGITHVTHVGRTMVQYN